MQKIILLLDVLAEGKKLNNVELWKNLQQLMNGGLLTFFILLNQLGDFGLTSDEINVLAEIVGGIGIAVNWYLTHATTDKIGSWIHKVLFFWQKEEIK